MNVRNGKHIWENPWKQQNKVERVYEAYQLVDALLIKLKPTLWQHFCKKLDKDQLKKLVSQVVQE